MANQLIWLNPENGKVFIRYSRVGSHYDIGQVNKYGHELINVIIFQEPILSTSLEDYYKNICKNLDKIARAHTFKNGLIKLLNKLITYLNKL